MEITDIRIRKVSAEGKLKAYVTVTFDDCFVVHNVKIIEGKNGAFIAMPSRKTKKGEYKDVAHPINSSFRGLLQERILQEYENQADTEPAEEEEYNTASSEYP
ncbi:MAG: septation regulator SpoVG [Spirochaetaceae bacterium]